MLAESVLRELGASKRTFLTVKGAMLWYRDQLAARLRVSRDLGGVGVPTSREQLEISRATFAAMARCLDGIKHVAWLVAWYESTDGDGEWLAKKAGTSRWLFTKRCRRTEHDLRSKLEQAGLLSEEP